MRSVIMMKMTPADVLLLPTLLFLLLAAPLLSLSLPASRVLHAEPLLHAAVVLSDSLEFPSFRDKLSAFFTKEKIQSIISKLPPNSKIFGYDVGEYSGDGSVDVVLSCKNDYSPARTLEIHFFLNRGSHFDLVKTLSRHFILEPIEVAFTIERGICHITEKRGEFNWSITGYCLETGVFKRVFSWETRRTKNRSGFLAVGYEKSRNLRNLLSEETYFGVNSGRTFLQNRCYELLSYAAGATLASDLPDKIGDSTAFMIVSGGSSWHGPEDCSIFVSSRHDSEFVYLDVTIIDDRLIQNQSAVQSDHFILCFNFDSSEKIGPGGKPRIFQSDNTLRIRGYLSDEGRTPSITLTDHREVQTLKEQISVRVSSSPTDFHTFTFKLILPAELFMRNGEFTSVGFSAAYHDVDVQEHLDWVTVSASARDFHSDDIASWGYLQFINDPEIWFEREDLRLRAITVIMHKAGINH